MTDSSTPDPNRGEQSPADGPTPDGPTPDGPHSPGGSSPPPGHHAEHRAEAAAEKALIAKAGATVDGLPADKRMEQGGALFLLSLMIFFMGSILLYGLYAYWRRDDPESAVPLPVAFLVSTACLILISVLVHLATRCVRRQQLGATSWLLGISALAAIIFTVIQCWTMIKMLLGPAMVAGTERGLVGMTVVLAILHALHVLGGIIALGIVAVGAKQGRYDHERHWPVDFAAQYWHFLDVVWLCMLGTFWFASGGFAS